MGLVDINQNNDEVQQFITQAPYTQGGNPFTSTPTKYSVSTNIDYTFKAGHSIGFAVGLGATSQGFTGTVYFDSATYSSGASVQVENVAQCQVFTADAQNVAVVSNSAISNCQYNTASHTIQFNAQGINYTTGYCNVSIPNTLMQPPFTVTSGTQQITPTLTENSTYYQLYFTNTRSTDPILITGTAANQPTATSKPTGSVSTSTPSPSGSSTAPTQTETSMETSPTVTSSTSRPSSTSSSPTQPNTLPTIPEYLSIAILTIFASTTLTAIALKRRLAKKV
jgi:hypothetical protein